MSRKGEIKLPKLPFGAGAFRLLKNGKVRFEKIHTFADGITKERFSATADTPQKCMALMDEKIKEADKKFAKIVRDSNLLDSTMYDAMEYWLKKEITNTVKRSTYDRSDRTVNNQIRDWPIGSIIVRHVNKTIISDHFNRLSDSEYSHSVISKTYDILNQFFRYVYEKDPGSNPMNGFKKPPRNAHGSLTEEDEDLLGNSHMRDMVLSDDEIRAFRTFVEQGPEGGSLGRSRYGFALYFVMMTFLRSGEARALKWSDIDLDKKVVQVTKTVSRVSSSGNTEQKTEVIITTPKTSNARRLVMITDDALDAITKYKMIANPTAKDEFVFGTSNGKPIGESQIRRALIGIMHGAALMRDPVIVDRISRKGYISDADKKFLEAPERKGFSMHYLRHTGISYYLRHGVPVDAISKMAGHASIEITRKIYYHVTEMQQRDALDIMNKI